ncbi:MAG: hypothetical protein NWQ54_06660 [Paraglaciecola sp.]|nr:hypothetical protein [Paraglaciecola sp.]
MFYAQFPSPRSGVFDRHADFFSLFQDFKGYVDFFLLQDLVTEGYSKINYWLNHKSFDENPLPQSVEEYLEYRQNTLDFIAARAKRIEASW